MRRHQPSQRILPSSMRHWAALAAIAGVVLVAIGVPVMAPGRGAAQEAAAAGDSAIPIAEIKRDTPVDFESEILPLFKGSCLACHNATTAESRLVLESPESILKGGDSGPAVVANNSAESLLLGRASGAVDSVMPPKDNKVAAPALSSEELGLIKLWIEQGASGNVTAGEHIDWQPLPPGVNPIYAVAVTPDGLFAACGRANQVFIYHLPTGRLVCRLTDPELLSSGIYQKPGVADLDLIQSLAFNHDGSVLASGGYRTIKLWRRPRDVRISTLENALAEGAQALAVSPDQKWLATADTDFGIKLWDLSTSQPAQTLSGHTAAVTALRFAADGTKLFSASMDKSVRAWQVPDGAPAGRLDAPQPIQSMTIVGDGTQLATGGADNLIRLWKAPSGPVQPLGGLPASIAATAVSADRKLLAVAGADGPITIVDLAAGQVTKTLEGHPGGVTDLAASPDATRLASTGADMTVKLWDMAAGQLLAQSQPGTAPLGAVAVHPGGAQVASGAEDGSISVWKLEASALQMERPLAGHTGRINDLVYNGDGSLIYTASADGTVRAFQSADGQQRFAASPGVPIHALAHSADGRWLAGAGENNLIHVWNAGDGSPTAKPQLGSFSAPVKSVAFSPDSRLVIGGGSNGQEVLVVEVESGEVLQGFGEHAAAVLGVAAAGEQADQVISASADGQVRVWPLLAGLRIAGHTQPVVSLETVASAPTQILSGSPDGTARLWNTADGQQLKQLDHGGPVTAVAVRPDGQRFASAGMNNVVRLWNAADNQQVAELKGDYRRQVRLAHLQRRLELYKNESAAAMASVTAAEQAATAAIDAVKAAIKPQEDAAKALEEKAQLAKAAAEAKAAADTALATATEAKKAADAAKATADQAFANADAAKKAADEAAAAAQTALDGDANNQDLIKAKQDADTAAANAATALAEAQNAKEAADQAVAQADANLKPPTDDAAAKTKAAEEAEAARVAAQTAKTAADVALTTAISNSAKATDAVPLAKTAYDQAEVKAKQMEGEVATAQQDATALEQPLAALAFSPDNLELAASGQAGIVHTYNATTGAACETYAGQQGPVQVVAYLGTERLVSGAADKSAVVWNANPEWAWERTIGGEASPELLDRVTALDFSPDGKLLASGSGDPSRSGELKIWNAADGALVREITDAHSDTVLGLDFSPEADLLASCGADKFVKVWEVQSGKFVRSFEGHTHHVLGVSWRADAKSLASCGADNVIKVWDFVTGDQRTTIGGFGKEVTSISYVGNTPNVLTSAGDKLVRLHNVDNGQVVRNFSGGADFMFFSATTPDGKIHIAGGQDSILRYWNGDTGEEIRNFPPPEPAPSGQEQAQN